MKSILVTLLLAAAAVAHAGEPSSPMNVNPASGSFRTDINPAMLYYQAFLVAPDPMPEADMDYLYSREGRSQKLPERFGKLFSGYDNQFKLVRQAARATVPCDWGIDMSAGPAALLPHLARAKAIAIAARFRVVWELPHGLQAEACDDLLGAFALGRNVARDGTLISALVQIAIEAIATSTVADNYGRFSPEALKQLAAGLDAVPPRRTVADCLPSEKAFFLDWAMRSILELRKQNPGDDAKVMEGIHQLLGFEEPEGGETHLWERLQQASGGTSDGVLRLMEDRERVYERLLVLLTLPYADYEASSKTFGAEILKSPNPFVATSVPGFLKARQREFRIQVWLAMVRAALEYRVHGEPGFQSVMDPCGQGGFTFERFVFQGTDRGFRLKSAYTGSGYPEALIFVEKEGPPFRVDGPHVGEAITK